MENAKPLRDYFLKFLQNFSRGRSPPRSHRSEKRAAAAEIIGSEQVRSRCEGAAGGLPVKLLCALMRTGSVPLNLAAFRGVALAGQRAPALFMKLKHRK